MNYIEALPLDNLGRPARKPSMHRRFENSAVEQVANFVGGATHDAVKQIVSDPSGRDTEPGGNALWIIG
jgi:hypothetical protein